MKWRYFATWILVSTFLFVSCDFLMPHRTDEEDSEYEEDSKPQLGFEVVTRGAWLGSDRVFYGLLLLYDNEYKEFNDEENYDDFAPIAMMAYLVGEKLYESGMSSTEIEQYLPEVLNLPINDEISDVSVKEIFNSVYYDNRDKDMYTTEEKYGFREFPYGQRKVHEGSWFLVASGLGNVPPGRNSIIIERASKESELRERSDIPPSAIFIKAGWFY